MTTGTSAESWTTWGKVCSDTSTTNGDGAGAAPEAGAPAVPGAAAAGGAAGRALRAERSTAPRRFTGEGAAGDGRWFGVLISSPYYAAPRHRQARPGIRPAAAVDYFRVADISCWAAPTTRAWLLPPDAGT